MSNFDYQRTVIAYHGCDESVCQSVLLAQESLRPSEKKYDWLGRGIYFWEYGPWRAYDWAQARARRGDGVVQVPAVLGAHIHLGRCFDLLDSQNTDMLSDLYPVFQRRMAEKGEPIPVNELHPSETGSDKILRFLDCAMLNWTLDQFSQQAELYQMVRGAFVEGAPSFPGSMLMARTHIQIAVRDPSCILGFFRPNIDFGTPGTKL